MFFCLLLPTFQVNHPFSTSVPNTLHEIEQKFNRKLEPTAVKFIESNIFAREEVKTLISHLLISNIAQTRFNIRLMHVFCKIFKTRNYVDFVFVGFLEIICILFGNLPYLSIRDIKSFNISRNQLRYFYRKGNPFEFYCYMLFRKYGKYFTILGRKKLIAQYSWFEEMATILVYRVFTVNQCKLYCKDYEIPAQKEKNLEIFIESVRGMDIILFDERAVIIIDQRAKIYNQYGNYRKLKKKHLNIFYTYVSVFYKLLCNEKYINAFIDTIFILRINYGLPRPNFLKFHFILRIAIFSHYVYHKFMKNIVNGNLISVLSFLKCLTYEIYEADFQPILFYELFNSHTLLRNSLLLSRFKREDIWKVFKSKIYYNCLTTFYIFLYLKSAVQLEVPISDMRNFIKFMKICDKKYRRVLLKIIYGESLKVNTIQTDSICKWLCENSRISVYHAWYNALFIHKESICTLKDIYDTRDFDEYEYNRFRINECTIL